MQAKIFHFDARVGGGYKMAFIYPEEQRIRGKSTNDADIFEGRFVELVPDEKIVEAVIFQTDNPDYAGTMIITTTLKPIADSTKVTIVATNVPAGISEANHRAGMASSFKNLASFIE